MKHTTTIVLAAVALFALAGCSNKKLIAQKDAEILQLQEDNARLQSEIAEQKRMTDELNDELAGMKEENRVLVEQKDQLTHITLDGAANFQSAEANLSGDGREVVDRIWSVLQNYPDRMVLVEGHADNRPIKRSYRWKYKSNWELSSARAHAVLHYLQDSFTIPAERLAAVGYGENAPVADNSTAEGQAQNRRVVITVGSPAAVRSHMNELEEDTPPATSLR